METLLEELNDSNIHYSFENFTPSKEEKNEIIAALRKLWLLSPNGAEVHAKFEKRKDLYFASLRIYSYKIDYEIDERSSSLIDAIDNLKNDAIIHLNSWKKKRFH